MYWRTLCQNWSQRRCYTVPVWYLSSVFTGWPLNNDSELHFRNGYRLDIQKLLGITRTQTRIFTPKALPNGNQGCDLHLNWIGGSSTVYGYCHTVGGILKLDCVTVALEELVKFDVTVLMVWSFLLDQVSICKHLGVKWFYSYKFKMFYITHNYDFEIILNQTK